MERPDERRVFGLQIEAVAGQDETQVNIAVPVHHPTRIAARRNKRHFGHLLHRRVHHLGQILPQVLHHPVDQVGALLADAQAFLALLVPQENPPFLKLQECLVSAK